MMRRNRGEGGIRKCEMKAMSRMGMAEKTKSHRHPVSGEKMEADKAIHARKISIKAPMEKNAWLALRKVAREESGRNSRKKEEQMWMPPTENPTNVRQIMSQRRLKTKSEEAGKMEERMKEGGKALRSPKHPHNEAIKVMDRFRPILSARYPQNGEPRSIPRKIPLPMSERSQDVMVFPGPKASVGIAANKNDTIMISIASAATYDPEHSKTRH